MTSRARRADGIKVWPAVASVAAPDPALVAELAGIIDRIRALAAVADLVPAAEAALTVAVATRAAAEKNVVDCRVLAQAPGHGSDFRVTVATEALAVARASETAARLEVESIRAAIESTATEVATLNQRRFELVALLNPTRPR